MFGDYVSCYKWQTALRNTAQTLPLTQRTHSSVAAYYRANYRQRVEKEVSSAQGCACRICSLGARGARRALEAAHRSIDLLRAGARKGAGDMAEAVAARASNLGHALAVKLVAEARRLRIDRRRGLPALAACA
eukprot:5035941-Prymnesium_polylepis.1